MPDCDDTPDPWVDDPELRDPRELAARLSTQLGIELAVAGDGQSLTFSLAEAQRLHRRRATVVWPAWGRDPLLIHRDA